jgi:hypothetical protein
VKEGDKLLTAVESSGVMVMERVDKNTLTKHVINTVVGTCHAQSMDQLRQSFAQGRADECVFLSSNHGLALKIDESFLPSGISPEILAKLRNTLHLVSEDEREPLATSGRAVASFPSSKATFIPARNVVKTTQFLGLADSLGNSVRIAALHEMGLVTLDMTGSLSHQPTFVVWDMPKVPKSLQRWVDTDG